MSSSSSETKRSSLMPSGWFNLSADQRREIRVKADKQLARRGLSGALIYPLLIALYLGITNSASEHPTIVWPLLVGMALATAVRVALIVRAGVLIESNLRAWRIAYGWSSAVSGGAWTLLVVAALHWGGASWAPMLLITITITLAVAAISTLAGEWLMSLTYFSVVLVPIGVGSALVLEGGAAVGFTLAALICWVFVIAQARRAGKERWELLFAPGFVRQLIDRNPTCVAVVRDGEVVYINPAWCSALARSIEDLQGTELEGLADAESGEVRGGLLALPTRFGDQRTFDVEPGQAIDFEGAPAILVVARDVTEQKGLVQAVRRGSDTIVSAAGELATLADQQQLGGNQQAEAVTDALQSIDAMLDASSEIGSAAEAVAKAAETSLVRNQAIAERTRELSRHFRRIDELLELTREIAARSEVLALNAALEGIRAGAAGHGFSLVADQIQQMAESVAASVGDVRTLTDDIQIATTAAIDAADEGNQVAEAACESARQIERLTGKQRGSTEDAMRTMDAIATVARQVRDGGNRTLEASEALAHTASRLKEKLDQFEL